MMESNATIHIGDVDCRPIVVVAGRIGSAGQLALAAFDMPRSAVDWPSGAVGWLARSAVDRQHRAALWPPLPQLDPALARA